MSSQDHELRVSAAREDIRRKTAEMGIDEVFIGDMVEEFYARIRNDEVLGPVFENQIKDNWDKHLLTMKRFWASVALNAGMYSGKPMAAHSNVTGIEADQFPRWLALFETTLKDIAPTPEAADYFIVRAKRIANSLQMGLFYNPKTAETADNI